MNIFAVSCDVVLTSLFALASLFVIFVTPEEMELWEAIFRWCLGWIFLIISIMNFADLIVKLLRMG